MIMRLFSLAALSLTAAASAASGQVVVDEGEFEVTVDGRVVGTEEFAIRRAGIGRDNTVFATGVVSISTEGGSQEVRPLLAVTPPEGVASGYEVGVTGAGAIEIVLSKMGRRYVSSIKSAAGSEDREFPAREDTRILEQDVAHHYYFLRDLRPGRSTHTLEPRTQRQVDLMADAGVDEQIQVGPNVVAARRVDFGSGDDVRRVWFDRQGRVLRVEIPARSYVAERTDVVG